MKFSNTVENNYFIDELVEAIELLMSKGCILVITGTENKTAFIHWAKYVFREGKSIKILLKYSNKEIINIKD